MRVEFSCEILEEYGLLSSSGKYKKALRLVSFNGGAPKYDLRAWSEIEGQDRPLKGVTFNLEELRRLRDILNGLSLEGAPKCL